MFNERMDRYDGDWSSVLGDIRVRRLILSEQDRVGIGTFQPKDEKNQDATELTGDINYRKIAEYGTESDPRAFNFDGEFNIANRGIIEFIEVLKLDVAFLYDLLGASQEHKIKPKKFAQTDIDEVIIGHTNEPEYKKLQSNEFMEALRDRTVKIDVPYVTRLSDEIQIYEKDYNSRKVRGKQIAPHTLEVAAMWAVLTRLEEPKNAGLTLLQKLKLYNGKTLPGLHRGQHQGAPRGGRARGDARDQPAVRPGQDLQRPGRARRRAVGQPVHGPQRARGGAEAPLADQQRRGHASTTSTCSRVVKEEYEDIVKNEVQRAIAADEDALTRLCGNYIDNVKAYTQREKVKNKYTGQTEEPDERLMRSIEEKIDIPESRKDDFRREIMNYIGALSLDGKRFDYKTNERLQKAPGAEALPGPEGHDQADEPGLQRRRQGHAGEDRHRQGPPDPQLRLRRGLGDRRPELRRQHLRPRRRQARQPLIGRRCGGRGPRPPTGLPNARSMTMATVTEHRGDARGRRRRPPRLPPHRMTVDRYERMVEAGVFGDEVAGLPLAREARRER